MKRRIRCLFWLAGGAFALVLAGCGSGVDDSTGVVSEAVSAADTTEEAPDPTTEVDESIDVEEELEVDDAEEQPEPDEEVEDVVEVSEFTAEPLTVSGETTAWVPGCNVSLPVTVGEGDCESVGGFTILPATLTSELSGTLEGSYTQHARYAVGPDGGYVFASIDTFVGTVGECGEGTIVFNSAGSGTFDTTEPLTDAPRSLNASWASYTAVESELDTVDVVLSTTSMADGSTSFETTGTINCGQGESLEVLVDAARPESSVDAAGLLEWTGTSGFSATADCGVVPGGSSPSCPSVDGFYVQGLANRLFFNGSFDGDARVFAAQLVDESDNWEQSSLMIFEGVVEGCGEGTVVLVNEGAGNNRSGEFQHIRVFTPVGFDSGPLGVNADLDETTFTGPVSARINGSYSCG